jgi:1-acyl-sn-glycerol-3-phosphate acyltransferase
VIQRAAPLAGNPALAASRIAQTSGQALEVLGRLGVDVRRNGRADARRLRAERMRDVARRVCSIHGFQLNVEGEVPDEPAVLISNHVSYIDAPALLTLTPATAIAKQEIDRWPIVGTAARSLGVVFVDRSCAWSGARAIRRSLRMLEAGVSVLGFPEGTTTNGTCLLPFKRGLFGMARLARVPIVPIAIRYPNPELCWYDDQLFLPHYLRTAMRPSTQVEIRIGAPIEPYSGADELATLTRAAIQRLLWRVIS